MTFWSFNSLQARPLLEEYAIDALVDPRLRNQYSEDEVYCMLHAASMCIRRDPQARPRMSQVIKPNAGSVIQICYFICF